MSNCEKCGRNGGHWIGCTAATRSDLKAGRVAIDPAVIKEARVEVEKVRCAFGDCGNDKRPKGKGPAPKYCIEHSDPKNRK